MKPTSEEKRADIVRLKQAKKKETEIAEFLGVCVGTVRKIWGIFIHTGSCMTSGYKGRTSSITPETEKKILEKIKENPSITLLEIIQESSLDITESGLSRRLKKQGMTYKKRLFMQKLKSEKMLS